MSWAEGLLKLMYGILIFLIGLLIGYGINIYSTAGVTGLVIDSYNLQPSNYVENKEIIIYPEEVVIKLKGAQLSSYDSTGSMLPTLGENVNGITIKPESEEDVNVGDIISFRKGDKIIVHRVVEKGIDEQGVYFITKGDNSPTNDGKIRFVEIERIVVGLIY